MKRYSLTNFLVCIIIMMAVFVFVPTVASAETYGFWTYTENSDGSTVTIKTYTGPVKDELEVPTEVEVSDGVYKNVSAIDDTARLGSAVTLEIGEYVDSISIESIRYRDDYTDEYRLENITVDAANTTYSSGTTGAHIGVLFELDADGNREKLFYYPAGKAATSYFPPNEANLTSIGDYAFYGSNLEKITLYNYIEEIGLSAFDNSSVMYVDFGEGITSLSDKLFTVDYDAALHLIFRGDVTSIDEETISCSSSNNSIYIHDDINSPSHIFAINNGYNFLNLDKGAVSASSIIDDYFIVDQQSHALLGYFNTTSTDVVIPNDAGITSIHADFVKSVGGYATTLTLADGIDTIDNEVIMGLDDLTAFAEVDNPNYGLVDGVLCNAALTEIIAYPHDKSEASYPYVTPAGITSIGDYAFYSSNNLQSVTLDTDVVNIGKYSFADDSDLDGVLAALTIANTTGDIVIEEGAFKNTKISTVTLPDSIKSIGKYAFANNGNLGTINFGDGVEFIHSYAFGNCDDLDAITLPTTSIKFIDEYAFYNTDETLTFNLPSSGTWVSSTNGLEVADKNDIPVYTENSSGAKVYTSYSSTDPSMYNSGFVYDSVIDMIVKYVGGSTEEEVETAFGTENATVIADGAFAGASIENLTVPSDFPLIPEEMASGSMINTVLLEGTHEIGKSAFLGCPLTSVTLPSTLYFIDIAAFNVLDTDLISSIDLLGTTWYNNLGEDLTEINDFDNDNYYYLDSYASDVNYNLPSGSENDTLNPDMYVGNDGKVYLRNAWKDDNLFKGWYHDVDCTDGNEILYIDGSANTLTIYPKFVAQGADEWAITYHLNGGNNSMENPFVYSGDEITLADPSKAGSIFGGWYTESSFSNRVYKINDDMADGNGDFDIDLYVLWTNSYDINYYDLLDGINDPANPDEYNSSMDTITLEKATRSGYAFDGWYESRAEGASEITQIVTSNTWDVNCFARWNKKYYINYNLIDGADNSSNPDEFHKGLAEDITLAEPTKDDMEFVGWYDNDEFNGDPITTIDIESTSDISLYAEWQDAGAVTTTYTIKYNLDEGVNSASNPDTFTADDLTITLANPTKSGCTFGGWYTDSGMTAGNEITEITTAADEEIWAKWTAVEEGTYIITYNLDEGVNSASNPDTFTADDLTITLADPTKSEYTFGGWYTDSGMTAGNEITEITTAADEEIWAKWIKDTVTVYTITYKLYGGANSSSNPATFTEETETITLASPTKSGSTFGGWYTDSSFTDANKVTQIVKGTTTNITLYAKWIVSYTLTYNSNGGSGSASVAKPAGSTFNLYNGNEFSRSGYVLDGWASSSSATEPDYLLGALYTMPESDKTLYAVWEADSDDDGISDDDEKAVGTDPNDDDDKPTTATIKGKVVDSDGNPVVGAIVTLNSDPVTTTTNASGIYEFDGVTLSPHTLTITDNGVVLGTYELNFTEGSSNSYSVSDSGSTDSEGVIEIKVTGESLIIELNIEQNAAGEWQVSDVDLNDSEGNDLPATATNNYLLLIISLVVIVGAAVGVALLIKKMRNSN